MRRVLGLLAISLMFASRTVVAAEPECPVFIETNTAFVTLTSYYGHSVDDEPYHSTISLRITDGPAVVYASSEGHPIGHAWIIDEQVAAECGQTPNAIFFNGFESGDVSAWQ